MKRVNKIYRYNLLFITYTLRNARDWFSTLPFVCDTTKHICNLVKYNLLYKGGELSIKQVCTLNLKNTLAG